MAAGVLATLAIRPERMRAALRDELLATDLADYLVRRGLPFRESHELVGEAVKRAEAQGTVLRHLPLSDYHAISLHFDLDLYDVFDFERSVKQRATPGGTARSAVLAQIDTLEALLPPIE